MSYLERIEMMLAEKLTGILIQRIMTLRITNNEVIRWRVR